MEFMVYLEKIMKCFGYRVKQGVHSGNSEIGMESTYSVTQRNNYIIFYTDSTVKGEDYFL